MSMSSIAISRKGSHMGLPLQIIRQVCFYASMRDSSKKLW